MESTAESHESCQIKLCIRWEIPDRSLTPQAACDPGREESDAVMARGVLFRAACSLAMDTIKSTRVWIVQHTTALLWTNVSEGRRFLSFCFLLCNVLGAFGWFLHKNQITTWQVWHYTFYSKRKKFDSGTSTSTKESGQMSWPCHILEGSEQYTTTAKIIVFRLSLKYFLKLEQNKSTVVLFPLLSCKVNLLHRLSSSSRASYSAPPPQVTTCHRGMSANAHTFCIQKSGA